jgi:excisionase family DNA binding protein
MSEKTRNASWVARHLNTSPQTVGRLIEEGKLQAYKLRDRGQWHVLVSSVDAYERRVKKQHGIEEEKAL